MGLRRGVAGTLGRAIVTGVDTPGWRHRETASSVRHAAGWLTGNFIAWFEAYLDGRWFTFDARHNTPRVGRVLMARGKDAVDVAITTLFGLTFLEKFTVYTDQMQKPQPIGAAWM